MTTKKNANLKLANVTDEPQQAGERINQAWEKTQEEVKITRGELRQRVVLLRAELEAYRDQMEGTFFDITSGNTGPLESLDREDRKFIFELVQDLNPLIETLAMLIDEFSGNHVGDTVFTLKSEVAETAFRIGVLAGAIFATGDKSIIDKFTRGLGFSLESRPQMIR